MGAAAGAGCVTLFDPHLWAESESPHQDPTSQGFPHSRPWHWTLGYGVFSQRTILSLLYLIKAVDHPSQDDSPAPWLHPPSLSLLPASGNKYPGTVKWKIGTDTGRHRQNIYSLKKIRATPRYLPPARLTPDLRFDCDPICPCSVHYLSSVRISNTINLLSLLSNWPNGPSQARELGFFCKNHRRPIWVKQ